MLKVKMQARKKAPKRDEMMMMRSGFCMVDTY
jgi:hypothetical protein